MSAPEKAPNARDWKSVATVVVLLLVAWAVASPLAAATPACPDCANANALDDVSGPAYAVAYSDVTFFLADDEAVDRFVANPEEEIPAAIKATQLWPNPAYWLSDNKAARCTCA